MLGILLFGVIGIIVFAFVVAVVAWPFVLVHKIRQTRKARKARKRELEVPWVEPTEREILGEKAWASKQKMDEAWAQVEEDRRQHPTQQ